MFYNYLKCASNTFGLGAWFRFGSVTDSGAGLGAGARLSTFIRNILLIRF